MKKIVALVLTAVMVCTCMSLLSVSAAVDSDYVTSGLVAFYDAGQQASGDTTWKDQSGKGNDMTVPNETGKNEFKDGVYLNTDTKVMMPAAIVTLICSEEFTTEIKLGSSQLNGTDYGPLMNCTNDAYSLFWRKSDDALEFKNGGNTRPKLATGAKEAIQDATITITFKAGGTTTLYINGEEIQTVDNTGKFTVEDMFFGHSDPTRIHTTEYEMMRFYDRALTADEVAQNYAADTGDGGGDTSTSSTDSTSSAVSSATSSTGTTPTGDAGYIAVAVIAVIALAGAVVVKKVR